MKDQNKPNAEKWPIQVYASYFDFMDEQDTTPEDIADFCKALREYAKGNFDYITPNKFIRSELRQIRLELKMRARKYSEKVETLKKNSEKGGEANRKRWEEKNEQLQSVDNHNNYEPKGYQGEPKGYQGEPISISISTSNSKSTPPPTSPQSVGSFPAVSIGKEKEEGFSVFERYRKARKEIEGFGSIVEDLQNTNGGMYADYVEKLAALLTVRGDNERRWVCTVISQVCNAINTGNAGSLPDIMRAATSHQNGKGAIDRDTWRAIEKWHKWRGKLTEEDALKVEGAISSYPTRDKWKILEGAYNFAFNGADNPTAYLLSKFKKPEA